MCYASRNNLTSTRPCSNWSATRLGSTPLSPIPDQARPSSWSITATLLSIKTSVHSNRPSVVCLEETLVRFSRLSSISSTRPVIVGLYDGNGQAIRINHFISTQLNRAKAKAKATGGISFFKISIPWSRWVESKRYLIESDTSTDQRTDKQARVDSQDEMSWDR